ncbi:uncharacterized protein LOC143055206 [Mytilus galloprovincialis]|uniref:uncharacterized protein LOC143055206 n=1 Tax=Mytilus galloprovincialis TaxID=29158 RepID=UPI003F7B3C78
MGEVDFIIGDNYNQANADHSDNFLYVHQTESQKRLLELYGNEICLEDATYRTTRYALPLYFICVPTNVNYITVASFIPEKESTVSLIEALNILKSWNPKWKPEFFMCDYAEEKINALETVFSDSFVYLCDFHREQAWERWVGATNNGVLAQKHDVLKLLIPLANAKTVKDFEVARNDLQRWVHASRQNRFNVNINNKNGIERQIRSLKYEFLMSRKASSLSHLLQVIVESFIPDTYKNPFLNIPFGNNFNSCAAVSVEVQNYGDDIDAENNEYITELPLPSTTRIKKTRQEFCSLCTEMKDLSYKTKDIAILTSVVEDANSILIKPKLNIAQTKEFILGEGGMTKTNKTNKVKKKKVKVNEWISMNKGVG